MGELLCHASFTSRLYINNTVLLRCFSRPCFHLNHYVSLTLTIPVVDDDVVCVLQVNHPPGVFAPGRVRVCALTCSQVWVCVSVDGPSGWINTTPVSYTLICGLVVCNISCDNTDDKCVVASEGAHAFLLLYIQRYYNLCSLFENVGCLLAPLGRN